MVQWGSSFYSPSRSAPSSTSPMSPVPADDSSSNRESVLRSNAMFSMPLVGVLEEWQQEVMFCQLVKLFLKLARQHVLSTTCMPCNQWDPCPAQGWTQWCPAHLSCPHFQANLHKTQDVPEQYMSKNLQKMLLVMFGWVRKGFFLDWRTKNFTSMKPLQHKQCMPNTFHLHLQDVWPYPLIWIWSLVQPAPPCSYCSRLPSLCLRLWWTLVWQTWSQWSLTAHPVITGNLFTEMYR